MHDVTTGQRSRGGALASRGRCAALRLHPDTTAYPPKRATTRFPLQRHHANGPYLTTWHVPQRALQALLACEAAAGTIGAGARQHAATTASSLPALGCWRQSCCCCVLLHRERMMVRRQHHRHQHITQQHILYKPPFLGCARQACLPFTFACSVMPGGLALCFVDRGVTGPYAACPRQHMHGLHGCSSTVRDAGYCGHFYGRDGLQFCARSDSLKRRLHGA